MPAGKERLSIGKYLGEGITEVITYPQVSIPPSETDKVKLDEFYHGLVKYCPQLASAKGNTRFSLFEKLEKEMKRATLPLLQSVELPPSIAGIGESAFADSVSLESVIYSHGIEHIASLAFAGCEKLSSFTFYDGLISIGEGAFAGCSSLSSIALPHSLVFVGYEAFLECNNLTSVVFHTALKYIGDQAFSGCKSLKHVTIIRNNGISREEVERRFCRHFNGDVSFTIV